MGNSGNIIIYWYLLSYFWGSGIVYPNFCFSVHKNMLASLSVIYNHISWRLNKSLFSTFWSYRYLKECSSRSIISCNFDQIIQLLCLSIEHFIFVLVIIHWYAGDNQNQERGVCFKAILCWICWKVGIYIFTFSILILWSWCVEEMFVLHS